MGKKGATLPNHKKSPVEVNLLYNIIILIVMLLTLGSCVSSENNGTYCENELEKPSIVIYCAKEKSSNNQIYFHYPQIEDDSDGIKKINEIIMDFVYLEVNRGCDGEFNGNMMDSPENWQWDSEYDLYAMTIDFEISHFNDFYLSIVFKGPSNARSAAHPYHYFTSLIIDIQEGKIVTLGDLYSIDDAFISEFRRNVKAQARMRIGEALGGAPPEEIPEEFEEILDTTSDDWIQQALQSWDKGTRYHCFLTDEAVGISIPIPFNTGDHFEILIPYDDLAEYEITDLQESSNANEDEDVVSVEQTAPDASNSAEENQFSSALEEAITDLPEYPNVEDSVVSIDQTIPDTSNHVTGNQFFFKQEGDFAYLLEYSYDEGFDEIEVQVSVQMLKVTNAGILYSIFIDPLDQIIEWIDPKRLHLGVFLVDNEQVIKLNTNSNYLDFELSREDLLENSITVCTNNDIIDEMGNEKGLHHYTSAHEGIRKSHIYNNAVETGYYETFIWIAGGLEEYTSGFGALRDLIYLRRIP